MRLHVQALLLAAVVGNSFLALGCAVDDDLDGPQNAAATDATGSEGGVDATARDAASADTAIDTALADTDVDATMTDTAAGEVAEVGDAADADGGDVAEADDVSGDATDADAATVDTTADTALDAALDTDVEADAEAPWFELGSGEREYNAVTDGDELMMAQGIQGGFHIWGGIRGAGFDPIGVSLEVLGLGEEPGTSVLGLAATTDLVPVDGANQASGLTMFLDGWVIPEEADGETWEVCGTLQSRDGVVLRDCFTMVARCCDFLDE